MPSKSPSIDDIPEYFQEILNYILELIAKMTDEEIPNASEAFQEFQNSFRDSMQYKKLIQAIVKIMKKDARNMNNVTFVFPF